MKRSWLLLVGGVAFLALFLKLSQVDVNEMPRVGDPVIKLATLVQIKETGPHC